MKTTLAILAALVIAAVAAASSAAITGESERSQAAAASRGFVSADGAALFTIEDGVVAGGPVSYMARCTNRKRVRSQARLPRVRLNDDGTFKKTVTTYNRRAHRRVKFRWGGSVGTHDLTATLKYTMSRPRLRCSGKGGPAAAVQWAPARYTGTTEEGWPIAFSIGANPAAPSINDFTAATSCGSVDLAGRVGAYRWEPKIDPKTHRADGEELTLEQRFDAPPLGGLLSSHTNPPKLTGSLTVQNDDDGCYFETYFRSAPAW